MEIKRLYRSRHDRIFAGICGGVGEYFGVDPTLIRVAWLLMTVFTGVFPGLITYLICIGLIPSRK